MSQSTYILRHVIHNAGLQGHVHVDCGSDPAQLALADVQDTLHLLDSLASKDSVFPCCTRNRLDSRLDFCKTQEVYICELLLILAVLG